MFRGPVLVGRLYDTIGERSLRRVVGQFCEHYHGESNHQGLENTIIETEFTLMSEGSVECRERLGGLLRYYTAARHDL